jgi:HD-like signal output (HDOD) protein
MEITMISSAPSRESLLRAAQSLPSAPRILAQLGRKIKDTNCGLEEITTLLKCDPALTARIIRVSNSVVYRTGEAHASLEEALLRLGLTEVYRITGFAAAAQLSESELPLYGVTAAQYRENALLTALVMEQLAPLTSVAVDEAYTAGLLRSIGKAAVDRWFCAPHSISSHNFFYHGTGPIEDWEIEHVGLPANEAAAMILADWNFPESTAAGVREHYRPTAEDPLATLLNLAAGAAERCGHGWPGEWSFWDGVGEKLAALGLRAPQLDDATRKALELFGPVRVSVS